MIMLANVSIGRLDVTYVTERAAFYRYECREGQNRSDVPVHNPYRCKMKVTCLLPALKSSLRDFCAVENVHLGTLLLFKERQCI